MQEQEKKNLRVAYVFLAYPSLHKTFVDREILILREMGIDVPVYSLKQTYMSLSPYQEELKKTITYLSPASHNEMVRTNLRVALRHPWRYVTTLARLLLMPHPRPFLWSRRRTAQHFYKAAQFTWHLMQDPPDHIHAHFLNESATAALVASRILGIPYSVEVHASIELFVTPYMIPEKLGRAKFVATCTAYNKDYLARLDPRLGPKTRVVYHGLDAEQYRRSQPPRQSPPLILGVGQLRERKGFQVLVEACGLLKQRGVDFECRIVGEGEMRPVLEEKIRRWGLENRVTLCGAQHQETVIEQYEQASVFTLPAVMAEDGDRDGIPNVLLEAMAMEVPVISTRHLAIPELVEDGRNGLLVPPDDPDALADTLQRLLEDSALRQRLVQAGRRTVLERFDPVKNAQLLVNAFLGA